MRSVLVALLVPAALAWSPACFSDTITVGLPCANDLECGDLQECGPDKACGFPSEENWQACSESACGEQGYELTACVNGYEAAIDCNEECAAMPLKKAGICGDFLMGDTGCGCAYLVSDAAAAPDCTEQMVKTQMGDRAISVVRSMAFGGSRAVYLETCAEWCTAFVGEEVTNDQCFPAAAAVLLSEDLPPALRAKIDQTTRPCLCELEASMPCEAGPPFTRCVGSNVAVCSNGIEHVVACDPAKPCGMVGGADFSWCGS